MPGFFGSSSDLGSITFEYASGGPDDLVDLSADPIDNPAMTADGSRECFVFNHYADYDIGDVVAVDASASTQIQNSVAAVSFGEQVTISDAGSGSECELAKPE